MAAPIWYPWVINEIGTRELPENRGPAIRRYIDLAHCGNEGDPWCAILANAAFEANGIRGTRSALARSFEHDPNFIRLAGPSLGCLVTYWRGTRSSGYGHVGFYNGEVPGYVSTIGGNEGDMVKDELLRMTGNSFGLSGYWWPKSLPLPVIGALPPQGKLASAGAGKVT